MLSTSSKYALRALMCLAQSPKEQFVSIEELSVKADAPGPYLAKLMKVLAKRKIVESRRGLSGGVRLLRGPGTISFFDVCVALDEPAVQQLCILSKRTCGAGRPCERHGEWSKIRDRFYSFLKESKIG